MKRKRSLGCGVAFSFVIIGLAGWSGEPTPVPDKGKTAFQAADTNADGKVTSEEMTQDMLKTAFAKMDKDDDRVITWDEWKAMHKDPGAREYFDAMDKNKDARVTFFEFSESAGKTIKANETFTALDKDENGTLSQDEYAGRPHFKILSVQF